MSVPGGSKSVHDLGAPRETCKYAGNFNCCQLATFLSTFPLLNYMIPSMCLIIEIVLGFGLASILNLWSSYNQIPAYCGFCRGRGPCRHLRKHPVNYMG